MPIYRLSDKLVFPHPKYAEDGVLAVGGDLSPERLLLAYQNGIFPWYSEDEPIVWHAPDPRFVLLPRKFNKSKSLRQLIKKQKYYCTVNQDFEEVISNCKTITRNEQDGTWITEEMKNAYIEMHRLGYAYSVEVYNVENELAGGLYGIKLGRVFFGESMFSKESNTSKIALAYLIDNFAFELIDAQVYTPHMKSLGAYHIGLDTFLLLLKRYI